ncbi:unnamed protein product [Clavelina lepadiformis]|uniref:Secreted protein n=1 Tax=Clavelina lepadiformis TaxID=159417 RepID=A0ABP0FKV2_CLALP
MHEARKILLKLLGFFVAMTQFFLADWVQALDLKPRIIWRRILLLFSFWKCLLATRMTIFTSLYADEIIFFLCRRIILNFQHFRAIHVRSVMYSL